MNANAHELMLKEEVYEVLNTLGAGLLEKCGAGFHPARTWSKNHGQDARATMVHAHAASLSTGY